MGPGAASLARLTLFYIAATFRKFEFVGIYWDFQVRYQYNYFTNLKLSWAGGIILPPPTHFSTQVFPPWTTWLFLHGHDYSGIPIFTGCFASCQAIMPFFRLLASRPAAVNLRTAGTLRCPVAQMQTISRPSGISFKRLPRLPRGINLAPGIWPRRYSSGWRTSSRKGLLPFLSFLSNSIALMVATDSPLRSDNKLIVSPRIS